MLVKRNRGLDASKLLVDVGQAVASPGMLRPKRNHLFIVRYRVRELIEPVQHIGQKQVRLRIGRHDGDGLLQTPDRFLGMPEFVKRGSKGV